MSTKYPKISITAESEQKSESSEEDCSSNDNDMNYNWNSGAVTDVEDLNSHSGDIENIKIRSRKSSRASDKPASIRNSKNDNDITDIEDYNDSDSADDDEDKSNVYPELKLSLQEFLQHGMQEQAKVNNETEEKVEIKAGNFLQAQNLNDVNDYVTDCEDYDTDSEIEMCCEKSVCVDLDTAVDGQGKVCIADTARASFLRDDTDENEDISVFSDISDMASALSDATGIGVHGMSEDELMEMSGAEEICQIAVSCSSESDGDEHFGRFVNDATKLPAIDVTFVSPSESSCSRKASSTYMGHGSSFLDIAVKHEEVLTDIERLDDSADEDCSFDSENDSEKPIPQAVILAPGDDGGCQTDVEEVFCEDSSSCISSSLPSVSPQMLPLPHREIILLRVDKFGDTITNVEPMNNEFQFGIYNINDDVPTDLEDYSIGETFDRSPTAVQEVVISGSNLIEGEVIISNEVLKSATTKRTELHSTAESITDVEEIYVAGTNRRKKLKTRSASGKGSKSKFLDVNRSKEEALTDVEVMDLSDSGLPGHLIKYNEKHSKAEKNANLEVAEKVTDIEDLTADESVSDGSGNGVAPVDIDSDGIKDYICNSANMVLSLEKDAASSRMFSNHPKMRMQLQVQKFYDEETCASQQHTDVEDIQMPSDVEDGVDAVKLLPEINENICTCRELNDMLNESYTVVHEKSSSAFNLDAEKLHIKDSRDMRDANTDVEYVESDEPIARGGN